MRIKLTLISQELKSAHVEFEALELSPKATTQTQRPQQVAALTSWLDNNEDSFKAVQSGSVTSVLDQPDRGVDVNASIKEHGSALHAASHSGDFGVVRLLLAMGADVNASGGKHGNALQTASYNGHRSMVRLLQRQIEYEGVSRVR